MKNKILTILSITITIVVFALSLRGLPGNPTATELNSSHWTNDGPFELSPERGRFALTYSLIEDHSPYFSVPIARFTTPDLGFINGHYVSLFAPGVSYVTSVGYFLGRFVGLSQVGTFAIVSFFALCNFVLLVLIGRKLHSGVFASLLGSLVFTFATPAFNYGVTLYQHHLSTFLMLFALYLCLGTSKWWKLSLIWFFCALSIPLDYPNLFLMLPIGLYSLRSLVSVTYLKNLVIRIFPFQFLTLLTVLIPLGLFLWFNQVSYGNPIQFSGTVASVARLDDSGLPALPDTIVNENDAEKFLKPELQQKDAVGFFKSRYLLNDLYIHLFSPDRGMLYFTPILLLSIFGIIYMIKHERSVTNLLLGIALSDLLLYSMWGDPWGGWAFGSRYLIPAYAILAIFLTRAISELRKNILFLLVFVPLAIYGIFVNTAGALTSSANPPKVEVLALEALTNQRERFSYDRNFELLHQGSSKSYIFQTFLSPKISAWTFYLLIAGTLTSLLLILVVADVFDRRNSS